MRTVIFYYSGTGNSLWSARLLADRLGGAAVRPMKGADALAAGDAESGCTVHRVDAVYDHGEILGQRRVPVLPGDDIHALADRVFAQECELYPEVVERLARELLSQKRGRQPPSADRRRDEPQR